MGFGLQIIDQQHQQQTKPQQRSQPNTITSSQSNAQLYTYYEDLIKEYTQKYPNANDKLALALIMGRGFKPTVSRNRQLSLLDIDKMISFRHKSIGYGDNRLENMKMAADLSGLKNNLLTRHTGETQLRPEENQQNQPQNQGEPQDRQQRGNLQIFRLIRAAQMHFNRNRRQADDNSDVDVVTTSQNRIEQQ